MPMLIWVFAGHTGHFAGFVMLRLKFSIHLSSIRGPVIDQRPVMDHIVIIVSRFSFNILNKSHVSLNLWHNVWTHLLKSKIEPPHDKTNKMIVRPAKTWISLGIRPVWSESSLCAQWVGKDQSFLRADSEDSDQTGRMPRLSLRWAHTHFVGFVMPRLKLLHLHSCLTFFLMLK